MPVCSFFLRGACKYGANCRNDHPATTQPGRGLGNLAWNESTSGGTASGVADAAMTFALTVDSIKDDLTPHPVGKPVCAFFLQGACKFGADCRNEHPRPEDMPWNGSTSGGSGAGGAGAAKVFMLFTLDTIKDDLTPHKGKPFWPLSCYGCAKYEPTMITGIDQSSEELRVMAVKAKAAGTVNDYMTYEANQVAAAENIYQNARNNILQFYEQAKQAASVKFLLVNSQPYLGMY